MHCTMVVLAARGGAKLAKQIVTPTPAGVRAYDAATFFDAVEMRVLGLTDVARVLKLLERQPTRAVVRGKVVGDEYTTLRRRTRLHADGYPVTFIAAARSWLAIDLDGTPYPEIVDAADPTALREAARDLVACGMAARTTLPAAFQNSLCIVQATSSHGIKQTIRLRLWFWCDRAVSDAEAERWLKGSPADLSLYTPVALCYTAAPLFLNGLADHLPRRLGFLPGEPVVQVPPPEALASPPRRRDTLPRFTCVEAAAPYARSELTSAIGMIRRAQHGERHTTIVRAASRTARLVHVGWLAEPAWRSGLLAAVADVAPDADPTNITAALDWALATVPTPGAEFDRDVH